MTNCPRCKGINGLKWNKDESFYGMGGEWNCRYCGHIIFKRHGTKHLAARTRVEFDERNHVLMITPRKKAEG